MSLGMLEVRVDAVREEAVGIRSYRLVDPARADLPPFTPGSHIDVHLGPELVRPYSLCNGPGDRDRYVIAVKLEPHSRGGSRAMFEQVETGTVLTIGAPVNNFPLVPDARRSLLIAGGIGIAPLLSMARFLLSTGAAFDLHYFAHSSESMAFRDVLSAPEYGSRVHLNVGLDRTAVGRDLAGALAVRPEGCHLYTCGPAAFMDLVETTASHAWPPDSMHREAFKCEPAAEMLPDRAFAVEAARSGGRYVVAPSQTILEVLRANHIEVEASCEEGVCGTCVTRVIAGVPDHRDSFLTDAQKASGKEMTICVSRAKTPVLVLDI